ncbi:MAG: tRNA (adenosine(37)-N6)-threonylcarbamoyltransferase complex dimerization subunit type 1 TsaB, partial [Verrucomicrobia bacterium]|nr:tRNA (adenosine(37)-N6)-threonylcarbamoyltransferase complex dimerization subunit type 1 TsaB [Verrucomicrobiota bacterium]
MTILAIETSTNHGSVAVLSNGQPIFFERFPADRRTSTVLFTVLERALALCQTLEQVAVGLGPGSYAGVRIAIAAALGIELGRGPLVIGISSVSTLETPAQTYFA